MCVIQNHIQINNNNYYVYMCVGEKRIKVFSSEILKQPKNKTKQKAENRIHFRFFCFNFSLRIIAII